jgi:transcriptional regulator with XRE-family HTH domain
MIGEALRLLRVYHDVKLKELANDLDISASFLSEVENGKRTPNLELINKYAKKFGVRSSAILFFSEEIDENNKSSKMKGKIRSNLIKFMQLMERYNTLEDKHEI